MTDALIGYSGFVGGAIERHRQFGARFRSTNIDDIRGRHFETVVCCGAPAEKWRANKDPHADRAQIRRLTDALERMRADRFILVSTIDVYPAPVGVDESSAIDAAGNSAYGRHRFELETFCRSHFPCTVVRLPGLFGRGLKKNAVFDLLSDRPVDSIPANAEFQFYDVERTWADITRICDAGIDVANITSEPVRIGDIATRVFQRTLPLEFSNEAPRYDVRSIHAAIVGGERGYWFTAEQAVQGIAAFVAGERAT